MMVGTITLLILVGGFGLWGVVAKYLVLSSPAVKLRSTKTAKSSSTPMALLQRLPWMKAIPLLPVRRLSNSIQLKIRTGYVEPTRVDGPPRKAGAERDGNQAIDFDATLKGTQATIPRLQSL